MTDFQTIIALGSNLGDKSGYIKKALSFIKSIGEIKKYGNIYRGGAYGNEDQPDFLNTAVLLRTRLAPVALLDALKEIEGRLGRKETYRWGPREIDLDIIFYERTVMNEKRLTLPHPDFHNRNFVLRPICDFAPDYFSPTHQKTVRELLDICPDKTKLECISIQREIDGLKI